MRFLPGYKVISKTVACTDEFLAHLLLIYERSVFFFKSKKWQSVKFFCSSLICGEEIDELFRHTLSKTCQVLCFMNILEKSEKMINTTYSTCRCLIARKVPLTIFSKSQAVMELQK